MSRWLRRVVVAAGLVTAPVVLPLAPASAVINTFTVSPSVVTLNPTGQTVTTVTFTVTGSFAGPVFVQNAPGSSCLPGTAPIVLQGAYVSTFTATVTLVPQSAPIVCTFQAYENTTGPFSTATVTYQGVLGEVVTPTPPAAAPPASPQANAPSQVLGVIAERTPTVPVAGQLPRTGNDPVTVAVVGTVLVGVGAVFLVAARRRRSDAPA